MKQVYWYYKNRSTGEWVYNHRDLACPDGAREPTPISEIQKRAWSNREWKREEK